ncbi:MAG: tyrosine-type recombinase/integrase [Verrucomicrobia bacterium]|nr:tyrosine-type recombinase/integrase [Verrucomicrobiota bacterium]
MILSIISVDQWLDYFSFTSPTELFSDREVLERELGDFSDYLRAKAKKKLPVWLTGPEIKRLLNALPEETRLMAQVMFGGGLRLMELLRLRVKDLDRGSLAPGADAEF